MSIVRFGQDGSSVYIYQDGAGDFVCCGCWLRPTTCKMETTAGLLEHLKTHRAAGHTVPEDVFEAVLQAIASAS